MADSTGTRPAGEVTYPQQGPRLYFNLAVFWFALSFLWAGMITIVMQSLVREMVGDRMKDVYLGWTLASGAFVSTITCIVVGALSDRSRFALGKRRPYIISGVILSVPALLWMVQVRSIGSIGVLILDFCLIQLWVNVATSPYQALIPDMVPKERQGTASAYMGLTSLVGQLGGLILTSSLIGTNKQVSPHGLSIIMAVLAGLLVLTMIYTAWQVRERPAVGNPAPRVRLTGTVVDAFRVKPSEHPDFFRLIASRFVINMGFYTATEFLLYYVSDTLKAPKPEDVVGYILVIATISGLIGNFPAGVLSDRVSKKLVIYISAAISATAALIFVLASTIPVALGAAFVFGMGLGAFMAVDWAFATNLLPERDEAKYMGVWHVAFTVPQVIAPLIGGLVAYGVKLHFGPGMGYRAVMCLVIVYLAIGTAMIRPIRERVASEV